MRDVLFLALAIGFFALAGAYVRTCTAVVRSEAAQDVEPGRERRSESGAAA